MSATIDRARIKEIMLSNGFEIKDGLDDLKPYVYEAAEHIAKIAREEALEEAAKICEESSKHPSSLWEEPECWTHSSEYCMNKIILLKDK